MLGRDLVDADAQKGAEHVAILSYEGWQTFFGGNPKVVGQTLRLGGDATTVVGVMPPGMRIPHFALAPKIAFQERAGEHEVLVFEPLIPSDYDLKTDMGNFNYKVIARLKPGVTLAQASAELECTAGRLFSLGASARPSRHLSYAFGSRCHIELSGALWLMFAAVGGVLLIACVNLANLQLARAVKSERETAVRIALGASKAQLMMARIAETLLLGICRRSGGSGAGIWRRAHFRRICAGQRPANNEVHVNLPVLLFAAGLSILAALSFGILPAIRSLRVDPQAVLQANSTRAVNSREGRRTRNLLVAAQVACTVVLLIVTSLVLRSFSHLLRQDRGFDPATSHWLQVDLFAPQYGDSQPNVKAVKLAFADRALTPAAAIAGCSICDRSPARRRSPAKPGWMT